jgi:hypothetical protein
MPRFAKLLAHGARRLLLSTAPRCDAQVEQAGRLRSPPAGGRAANCPRGRAWFLAVPPPRRARCAHPIHGRRSGVRARGLVRTCADRAALAAGGARCRDAPPVQAMQCPADGLCAHLRCRVAASERAPADAATWASPSSPSAAATASRIAAVTSVARSRRRVGRCA